MFSDWVFLIWISNPFTKSSDRLSILYLLNETWRKPVILKITCSYLSDTVEGSLIVSFWMCSQKLLPTRSQFSAICWKSKACLLCRPSVAKLPRMKFWTTAFRDYFDFKFYLSRIANSCTWSCLAHHEVIPNALFSLTCPPSTCKHQLDTSLQICYLVVTKGKAPIPPKYVAARHAWFTCSHLLAQHSRDLWGIPTLPRCWCPRAICEFTRTIILI